MAQPSGLGISQPYLIMKISGLVNLDDMERFALNHSMMFCSGGTGCWVWALGPETWFFPCLTQNLRGINFPEILTLTSLQQQALAGT